MPSHKDFKSFESDGVSIHRIKLFVENYIPYLVSNLSEIFKISTYAKLYMFSHLLAWIFETVCGLERFKKWTSLCYFHATFS